MSLYEASVPQFTKMLKNLGRWLDSGAEHAAKKSFKPEVLLAARLAPDQYPLLTQIQVACDSAKLTCARLTGKEAPKHPDTEQTVEELRARIQSVVGYLETFSARDFEGAESRSIGLPFAPGKIMSATDYLNEFGLPNFYFHLNLAYAILRHNGVALGKTDYIGSLNWRDG
ncbi:MAG TPA: DUF1993 domain-containing protein [Polyangiaceae bacterium]|nr:DUF1993 domain-containing protein [Polyangiaceae bacterium]